MFNVNKIKMKYNIFLLLLFSFTQLYAQRIELPSEHIFIFSDKPAYKQGDTIQLYGHLLAADRQYARYSNYIYVELFNKKDSVLVRHKTRCQEDGSFSLPIETDYNYPNAIYYVRAYTRLMQNFNPESFPVIELPVGLELFLPHKNVPGVKCFFFPEGGQWVNGDIQNMTVYLTDGQGTPLQTPFCITNHVDTLIQSTSLPSGLQTIRIYPREGDSFRLLVSYEDEYFSFPLPERADSYTLQTAINRNRISYKVISDEKKIDKERLFVFHPNKGMEEIQLTENQRSGLLSVSEEENGLYVFWLTDESAAIIAQTVLRKEGEKPEVVLKKKSYSSGEILELSTTNLEDTLRMYHRIVKRGQIAPLGDLLSELESELLSPVPFPRQYSAGEKGQTMQDMEAWLRTTRFIRFEPAHIVNKELVYRFQPEIENQFTGLVTRKSGKLLRKGSVVAYNANTHQVNTGEIDVDGRYMISVTDFAEGNRFFLQAHPEKGSTDFYEYIPDNDTFPPVLNRLHLNFSDQKYAEASVTYQDSTGFAYQVDEFGNRDYIMPEITVKARIKQDKHVSSERFYQTDYMDEEIIQKRNLVRLEDIFVDMPGVNYFIVEEEEGGRKGGTPKLTTMRGSSTLGGSSLVVLLDGIQMDLSEVLSVPVEHIASVELLKPWQTNAVTFGAINGALAITTKKRKQEGNIASKGFYYYPLGLTQGEEYVNKTIQVPTVSGPYDLLIDIVTKQNEVHSFRLPFEVR